MHIRRTILKWHPGSRVLPVRRTDTGPRCCRDLIRPFAHNVAFEASPTKPLRSYAARIAPALDTTENGSGRTATYTFRGDAAGHGPISTMAGSSGGPDRSTAGKIIFAALPIALVVPPSMAPLTMPPTN